MLPYHPTIAAAPPKQEAASKGRPAARLPSPLGEAAKPLRGY